MSDENTQAPVQTLRDGAVVVKLWRQESKKGPFVSATVGRTYRDEQTGEYGESRSLSGADMLKAHALLLEAHQEAAHWRAHFRETEPEHDAPQSEQNLASQRDEARAKAKPRRASTRERARDNEREH